VEALLDLCDCEVKFFLVGVLPLPVLGGVEDVARSEVDLLNLFLEGGDCPFDGGQVKVELVLLTAVLEKLPLDAL
jgi:hypothetical protein